MSESNQNNLQFYAAGVNAWFNTRLEHDKSLLTLSAGGIALLVTLLSTVGIHSIESLILYILALGAFIISLMAVLWIFKRNAQYLEGVIKGNTNSDQLLGILDTVAISGFLLGVLLTSVIGIAGAVYTFKLEEKNMADNQKETTQNKILKESFDGAANLIPSQNDVSKKSFDGAHNLLVPTPEPVSSQQGQSQPAQSQQNDSSDKK